MLVLYKNIYTYNLAVGDTYMGHIAHHWRLTLVNTNEGCMNRWQSRSRIVRELATDFIVVFFCIVKAGLVT